MDASGYTIKQVWQVLHPLLEENDNTPAYQALINWLYAASHGKVVTNAQGQPVIDPPSNTIHLIAPTADKDLILHHNQILKQALPGLGQPTLGLKAALFTMGNAMMAQTTDQKIAHETRANDALQPILPSMKFCNTVPILMEYP